MSGSWIEVNKITNLPLYAYNSFHSPTLPVALVYRNLLRHYYVVDICLVEILGLIGHCQILPDLWRPQVVQARTSCQRARQLSVVLILNKTLPHIICRKCRAMAEIKNNERHMKEEGVGGRGREGRWEGERERWDRTGRGGVMYRGER